MSQAQAVVLPMYTMLKTSVKKILTMKNTTLLTNKIKQ